MGEAKIVEVDYYILRDKLKAEQASRTVTRPRLTFSNAQQTTWSN